MQFPYIQTMLVALVAALLAMLSGCSPNTTASEVGSTSASVSAPANIAASTAGRSLFQTEFIQMFEKECLPRIPADAGLSQKQKTNFCQCYAAAMTDNNNDMQLTRYLAGQDQEKLRNDADNYGKPCLERVRKDQ